MPQHRPLNGPEWASLGEVAVLTASYPFRGAVVSEPGGTVAVVQLQDVGAETLLDQSLPRLINDGKYDRYFLTPGDIVLQARGLRHPAALVRLMVPAISAPGLHALRPDRQKVTSNYLAWCLNHPKTQAAISAVAQGTHSPFIGKQTMGKIKIPLPPLFVQQRIAEVEHRRELERVLAVRIAVARDSLVNAATWEAALGRLDTNK